GLLQLVFRPGDPVTFGIPLANFTAQPVNATVNYSLTGPGNSSAGSGALNFSMPAGVSFQFVNNLSVPTSAQQGLFAFSSKLTAGSNSSTKSTAITVVPKTTAETITVENVFVSDPSGTPRGGFAPSSDLRLNVYRLSTFPVSVQASIRYKVT